jgi:hypothetical protein
MEDSKTQAGPSTPPVVTTEITMVRRGATIVQRKDAQGRFLKRPKPLIPTIEYTRAERKFFNKARADGKTEYMHMFENMVRIAQYDGDDAKLRMAAVCAYKETRLSALGKPAPSEVEMDKLTTQPVKVVIINSPELMHPEVQEEKKAEVLTPSFAQVTEIRTNPKA